MVGLDADFIYRESQIELVEDALFSRDFSTCTASALWLGTALTSYLSVEPQISARQLSDRLMQFNIFCQEL